MFLPIYGQRRQYDLRLIALKEIQQNFRIQGQMNFDSGWEYGYWMNDIVTARSSWNPMINRTLIETNTTYEVKDDQWIVFAESIQPFTKIYGTKYSKILTNIIVNLTISQQNLLIYGIYNNTQIKSLNINKLSGIAYLSGDDTWIDIPRMFGLSILQADKVRLKEINDPLWNEVILLLQKMDNTFNELKNSMKNLLELMQKDANNENNKISIIINNEMNIKNEFKVYNNNNNNHIINHKEAMNYFYEIYDCITLLSMRTNSVRMLYESMDPIISPKVSNKAELLRNSRLIINQASNIIIQRESQYRVPWQRVGAWRDNPTVYRFGYLWSAHSLYYWWRDQGLGMFIHSFIC